MGGRIIQIQGEGHAGGGGLLRAGLSADVRIHEWWIGHGYRANRKSFKSELLKWENENGGKARWRARSLPQVTLLAQSSLSEDEFEEIIDSMSNWIKSNQRIRTVMEKSLVAGVQVHWVGNAKNEELTKISPKDTMIAFAFHNGMILALTGGRITWKKPFSAFKENPRIPVWLIPFHFRIPSMRLKRGKRGHSLTSKRFFPSISKWRK